MTSMFFTASTGTAGPPEGAAVRAAADVPAAVMSAAFLGGDVVLLGVLARGVLDHGADGLGIVGADPVRDDVELGAVPLHHPPALGAVVLGAGQLEGRDHALDAQLLQLGLG